MSDCLFCKIVSGTIPCKKVYEEDDLLAFNDIHPKGPVHILWIPKKHYATFNDIPKSEFGIVSKMHTLIQSKAKELKIDQTGYRVLVNVNAHGGQEVYHVHWHLIGGKKLGPMA